MKQRPSCTSNSQIGEIFGLAGSAVSRRVGVLKAKAENDQSIRKKIASQNQ
jgi:hypothetical protein